MIFNQYEKFEFEEHEGADYNISNPHYSEVRIATFDSHLPLLHEESTITNERPEIDSPNPKHASNPTAQQHPHPEVEETVQMNNSCNDRIKDIESCEIIIKIIQRRTYLHSMLSLTRER